VGFSQNDAGRLFVFFSSFPEYYYFKFLLCFFLWDACGGGRPLLPFLFFFDTIGPTPGGLLCSFFPPFPFCIRCFSKRTAEWREFFYAFFSFLVFVYDYHNTKQMTVLHSLFVLFSNWWLVGRRTSSLVFFSPSFIQPHHFSFSFFYARREMDFYIPLSFLFFPL